MSKNILVLGLALALASCAAQTPQQQLAAVIAGVNGVNCAAGLYAAGKASTSQADTAANVTNGVQAVTASAMLDPACQKALAAAQTIVEPQAPMPSGSKP